MTEENIVVVPCGTTPISSGSFNQGSSYYANILEVLNGNPMVTGVVIDALVNYEYFVNDTSVIHALMKAKTALEFADVLTTKDNAREPVIIKMNCILGAIRDAAFRAADPNKLLINISVTGAVDILMQDIVISAPSDVTSGRVVVTIPEKYVILSGLSTESKSSMETRMREMLSSRPDGIVYTIIDNTVRAVARGTGSFNRHSTYGV